MPSQCRECCGVRSLCCFVVANARCRETFRRQSTRQSIWGPEFLVLLIDAVGGEQANAILDSRRKGASAIRMPNGIFESYCQQVWHVRYTQQRRKALGCAFAAIAERRLEGTSRLALRKGQRLKDRRIISVKPRNCKAWGLGMAPLSYFVDDVQQLYCRAGTNMLMDHARLPKRRLGNSPQIDGVPLPKLTGSAGKPWFHRWRLEYKIVARVAEIKLKVSWSKVKRRTRVLLQNIFRLRALWAKCHAITEM